MEFFFFFLDKKFVNKHWGYEWRCIQCFTYLLIDGERERERERERETRGEREREREGGRHQIFD